MELRTYTGLWNVEKRLYKFYDMNLPYPVSVKQLGIFFGVALPWALIMTLLHVPFGPPFGHILWLAPPVVAVIFANKPIAEGKTLTDFVLSQIKFFLSARKFDRLTPETNSYDQKIAVEAKAWHRNPSS